MSPREGRHDCPRCGKAMEQGFVFSQGPKGSVANTTPAWAEGTPVMSFWRGLRLGGRRVLPVQTFRCKGCGHLESYAPDNELR